MQETRIIDPLQTHGAQGHGLPNGFNLLGGKFRIDGLIGAGGFGITYLAMDTCLERAVVIKECFPDQISMRFGNKVTVTTPGHQARFRKIVAMFMREARSLAKLRHPNIGTVHQAFEENGTAYMVLDLFEGRDLLDVIADGDDALVPDQLRDIVVKLLDAIALVHASDLLHRDISPDNILLDKWGTPALIDFGAAREDASDKTVAVSTMLVVKDGYSPPEFYVAGGVQGPFSDLYAFAATIYHLITKEVPISSQTRVLRMANGECDPYVPLAGRFPQYDSAFLQAIDQAMRVSAKERLQSARAWLDLIAQDAKPVKTVKRPATAALTKTLSALIEETNKHALNQDVAKRVEAPPRRTAVQAETHKFAPEWLEEFNRETLEGAGHKRGAKQARLAALAEQAADQAWEAAERVWISSKILEWMSRTK